MEFWKSAADSVTKAVDYIVDRNRKLAMMNRLKVVIKGEKDAQNQAYEQLGRYYYQNLRDPENGDTEPYCQAVDTAGARLRRAYARLDELAVPTAPNDPAPTDAADEDFDSDVSDVPPAEDDPEFHPDVDFRPDVGNEEAADEDQDFLHPFSVVPNDKPESTEDSEETKQ
jgi:hypothetical protein